MKEINLDEFNKHYKENPPKITIDDTGVRHKKEVVLPAKFERTACSCGILHEISGETWYHGHFAFFEDKNIPGCIKVVKRCKKCDQILMLKLVDVKED